MADCEQTTTNTSAGPGQVQPARRGGGSRAPLTGRAPATLTTLTAFALLLLAGGCGPSEPTFGDVGGQSNTAGAGEGPPATPEPSTTLPLDNDERVLADYQAYWDDAVTVLGDADGSDDRLDDHATGQALADLQAQLREARDEGKVARGKPELLATRLVTRAGEIASVRDCIDFSGWLYHDAATGALRDEPSGKRYRASVALFALDGAWKVSTVTLEETRCGD